MKPETMLPERLRELRSGIKMTQAQIATALGESVTNYNKWENGTEPALSTIIKIAKFHGVTTDYLLGYNKPQNPDECIVRITADVREDAKRLAGQTGISVDELVNRLLRIALSGR